MIRFSLIRNVIVVFIFLTFSFCSYTKTEFLTETYNCNNDKCTYTLKKLIDELSFNVLEQISFYDSLFGATFPILESDRSSVLSGPVVTRDGYGLRNIRIKVYNVPYIGHVEFDIGNGCPEIRELAAGATHEGSTWSLSNASRGGVVKTTFYPDTGTGHCLSRVRFEYTR